MEAPIINVLFVDIGNVLLTNGWDRVSRRRAAEKFALDIDEMNERHHLTFDTYEAGKLALDDYLRRTVFYTDRPFTPQDFKAFMLDQSQPLPDMLKLVRGLKTRYHLKVVAVSNEGRELTVHRIRTFDLGAIIDFFISSCFVGLRKPDADMYRLALNCTQAAAEKVLYIDDRRLFVDVARGLGIRGIHHRGYAETRTALEAEGLILKEKRGVTMTEKTCAIGLVGLGVMGRNLVLNIADHGFGVAGYDLNPDKTRSLQEEKESHHAVETANDMGAFLKLLQSPRTVMLLVPAGDPVDKVMDELLRHLENGDLIIDAGNSYFADTNRRIQRAAEKGVHFLGMGVSGGEKGARNGPSMMPGGAPEAYERIRSILEAAAARVDDAPCVAYLGPGSAGHYVKMVHNGIEYGIMELIAETYDLMTRGLGLSNDRLHEIYDAWDRTELSGYLMQITARIFERKDEKSGRYLVDQIMDRADQKGTGTWTVADALTQQVPVPTIDLAVQMRNLSMLKQQRLTIAESFEQAQGTTDNDAKRQIEQLRRALYAGMILTYAQGMALLDKASQSYGYRLDLKTVARIWRGGCIIRADLLENIMAAFERNPGLPNLLIDPELGRRVAQCREDLAAVSGTAAAMGIPAPGLMVSLAYFDAFRSARLPANLIQAQRDYFGAHTYARVDAEGHFHTDWEN